MSSISDFWKSFDKLVENKRDGEIIEKKLNRLAATIAKSAQDVSDSVEYERHSNLFYHCQEILLVEYGSSSSSQLPKHPLIRNIQPCSLEENEVNSESAKINQIKDYLFNEYLPDLTNRAGQLTEKMDFLSSTS